MSAQPQAFKVYTLFGANGTTMQELKADGLKLGQIISYSDIANPQQKAVVVEDIGTEHGQRVIFIESLHETRVSSTHINAPGGWRDTGEFYPVAHIPDLVARSHKSRADYSALMAQKREEAEKRRAKGKIIFEAARPAWAQAAIIATYQIDDCDSTTDYFNTKTGREVFLGWSKHERNLFSEMREAAARFPETAHLGPGCDIYQAVVVLVDTIQSNGSYYHAGSRSHWHRELGGNTGVGDAKKFHTEAEARAYIEQAGEPEPISFQGTVANFKWDIWKESIEHRENYSGGRGMVLGEGGYRTGWTVKKWPLAHYLTDLYTIFSDPANVVLPKKAEKAQPAQATATTGDGIEVRHNDKGIEIEFPGKPSEDVLNLLRGVYRWHRQNKYWYAKHSTQAQAIADQIAAQ